MEIIIVIKKESNMTTCPYSGSPKAQWLIMMTHTPAATVAAAAKHTQTHKSLYIVAVAECKFAILLTFL